MAGCIGRAGHYVVKSSYVVFVTRSTGHNPNCVQWLSEGWAVSPAGGRLYFVVAPDFPSQHAALCDRIADASAGRVRIMPLAPHESRSLIYDDGVSPPQTRPILRVRRRTMLHLHRMREWRICRHYVARLQCAGALFLNFDFYHPFAAARTRAGFRFSGINHHFFLHYEEIFGETFSAKERLRAAAQRLLLPGLLRNSSLDTLFLLDPFLAEHLRGQDAHTKVVHLPTPARLGTPAPHRQHELRAELALEPGRKVFLMLGGISPRRGADRVLDALRSLDEAVAARACVLFVGRHTTEIRDQLDSVRASSVAQVVARDEFVPEQDIASYYQLSDFVLVTHRRHYGTSLSLAYAAAARKPVLASNFGLVAALTRKHKLGLTVDARNPSAIAVAMQRLVDGPLDHEYDPASASDFATENTVERFTQVLIANLTKSA